MLDLSTVSNGDLFAVLAIPGPRLLHGSHNIPVLFCLAKDHLLGGADEELRTIHFESNFCQDEVLISFLTIDRLAVIVIMVYDVTILTQKSQNNPVNAGIFITKSFLPRAQSMKVFCCLWIFANGSRAHHPRGYQRTQRGCVDSSGAVQVALDQQHLQSQDLIF